SPPAGAAPVEERRRQDRSHIRLPLRLTVASVDQVFETEALNISKGGMFIATEAMPPVGAEVDVEIALQSGTLLFHATGTVVRHQTYGAPRGIAVRLGDVSYEAQALIDRMLRDERLFGG